MGKTEEMTGNRELVKSDFISVDNLAVPMVSQSDTDGRNIKSHIGLVTGEAVAQEKLVEGRFSKLTKLIRPVELDDIYLSDARELAVSRMMDEAKSLGANGVSDVSIDFVSIGGFQGSATIVTATGTAIIYG